MASTLVHAAASGHEKVDENPVRCIGVQDLVDAGIASLPQIYVRPTDERPVDESLEDQFPLIDISPLDGAGRSAVVQAIGHACQEWGFFLVKNHGVSTATMEAEMRVGREFFHLPSEEKMRYFSLKSESPLRYGTSFNAKEDDVFIWRDYLRYSFHDLQEIAPFWPDKPKDFREVNEEFCKQIKELGSKLLGAISESLGLGSDYIDKAFGEYYQYAGYNFYPPCPSPDLTLGTPSHTDISGVTILMQNEVPGLQVLHNDRWVTVQSIPNTLVINLGDMLQVLTNGKYKSAEHRAVVNGNQERISVPTAYGPSMESFIAPAPELLDSSHPAVYKGCLFGDYVAAVRKGFSKRKGLFDSLKIATC
eukprot:Gb_04746 [translate_table: standard]